MKDLLEQLLNKKDLTEKQASKLLEYLISGEASDSFIASVLTALRMKGETEKEILGFIKSMRKNMLKVDAGFRNIVLDTCGTGGDSKGTFNISTTVAFVVAGAGVPVAKHGNRSVSSKCGSADVLESLGVNVQLTPEQASHILEKVGMVFLFAPLFHPAMKNVGKVRKELGVRTVFNFLGPFSNPAGVKRQIIGVPNKEIAEKLSHVAIHLGYEHLLIVTSENGMDEIDIIEKTYAYEVKGKDIRRIIIDPKKIMNYESGIMSQKLKGGTAEANARIILNILKGEKGAERDIVIFNAAYALLVAGKVKNVVEGIILAEKSIDSGSAEKVLEMLIEESPFEGTQGKKVPFEGTQGKKVRT